MENIEHMDWENLPSPADSKKELKKIQKSLRKRSTVTVVISLVLAAVLLLGAVQYGIPALESLYWDPRTVSYGTAEGTDLDMVLAAYDDLFSPTTCFMGTRVSHTGFASYSLTVKYRDGITNAAHESYGTLEKGELFLPDGIWKYAYHNQVGGYWMTISESLKVNRQHISEKLSQLPEYIQVGAYVTFTEDKSLAEIFAFRDELGNQNKDRINQTGYYWTAIRHSTNMDNTVRCGLSSESCTNQFPEVNEYYPAYSQYHAYDDLNYSAIYNGPYAQTYEEHFKSLLKYLDDQLKQGAGIPAPASATGEVDMDYYAKALAYVEENGVMAYGCYIVGSPQALLELMDREDVLYVYPTEGWLNI